MRRESRDIAGTQAKACETQDQDIRRQTLQSPHRMCDLQVSSNLEACSCSDLGDLLICLLTPASLRIRHIKCDEEKPNCRKCRSTGRRCDGYVPVGAISLTVDVRGDHEERRGYHFFRLKSIGEIIGQQDADFWKRLFLQASHSQPAVKHALIAIASVHESLELAENDAARYYDAAARKRRAFSLIHYNKAIQLLVRDNQDSSDRLRTILIMCILFIVFEGFQSGYIACALHLQSGLALLHQWISSRRLARKPGNELDSTEDLINKRIAPAFNRFIVQASTFADSRIHAGQYNTYTVQPTAPAVQPRFGSFAEAREALDEFMRWMFYSVNNPKPSSVPVIRGALERTLEDWRRAFSHFWPRTDKTFDPQDLRAARLMQIYYHVSFIIIDAYLSDDEIVFDKHVKHFGAIVETSREILSTDAGADGEYKLSFSFDFGVTPPLYFTASHCRDPLIRRRALALMRLSYRKQGCWNSEHSAKCAEEIIKIEEGGLVLGMSCKDVPEENRIRKVYADVQQEKGFIKLMYVHAPYDLKAPLRTVYIPLGAGADRYGVAEQLASGTMVDQHSRLKPDERTSIAAFVSKTYFPQQTI